MALPVQNYQTVACTFYYFRRLLGTTLFISSTVDLEQGTRKRFRNLKRDFKFLGVFFGLADIGYFVFS